MRLATRSSPLALVQAEAVATLLAARASSDATGATVELVAVTTAGDRRRDVPIHSVGGQGVFVKEVELAVLEGRADAAVHSAKDLPASEEETLRIAAVPERADPRDALVGARLFDMAPGALVATGSVRRRAQLAWLRPDLTFTELRGNLATRVSKVPRGGAVVVALAALERLGWLERADEVLDTAAMLPQAGQGAIAVCTRPEDERTAALLAVIDDRGSHLALAAERAYLRGVGGGCDQPVGAHAVVLPDGTIRLEAMMARLDGHALIRERAVGSDPDELGRRLARRVLEESGGRSFLAEAFAGRAE